MRTIATLHPIGSIPMPPDTVQTLLIAASSGQAMDWASGAAASSVGAHIVRFTGLSTLGAQMNFTVNLVSTHAAAPSSGTSVTTGTTVGSTGNNIPVIGQQAFQIPSWSTGFSVAGLSSGYVMAEIWRK